MNKDELAAALAKGGVHPVYRCRIGREDVFIADGFVPPPHHHLAKFNVSPDDFPDGCYMTVWWTEQKDGWGGALFCEPHHDPLMADSFKQRARINSAIQQAAHDIHQRNRVSLNG